MNKEIIPKKTAEEAKKNLRPAYWIIFARRMQKNLFMRDYIVNRHNYICAWCNTKLHKFVLHHIDYEHECKDKHCLKIKLGNKNHFIPDCEKCYNDDILEFNECAKRVVPVHAMCNLDIEKSRAE